MSQSLSDTQLTMLRLAKRHLALPPRDVGETDDRNDLAILVMLKLVEPHDGGFRITQAGASCIDRLDRGT